MATYFGTTGGIGVAFINGRTQTLKSQKLILVIGVKGNKIKEKTMEYTKDLTVFDFTHDPSLYKDGHYQIVGGDNSRPLGKCQSQCPSYLGCARYV
jgi:hypothetical protein